MAAVYASFRVSRDRGFAIQASPSRLLRSMPPSHLEGAPWRVLTDWPSFVSVIAFGMLLGCTPELPSPSGSNAVGTRIVNWIDPTRAETFSKNPTDLREVLVEFG